MEDVSASKNSKQTNTKKDKEDMMPKTPFSKMKRITDTNIGTVDMISDEGQTKRRTIPLGKEEIQNAIAQHSPNVDTSITTMMSNDGMTLDFEENINETDFGLRLDELGKVAIKKKHFGHPFLSQCFYWMKEYKDHENILQVASSVVKLAELRAKHTPCPPMEEVNEGLAKFIVLAKKTKEKGRFIL